MLKQPHRKYRPFPPVVLTDRTWPSRTITHAPIWLSTDLRDGNQALFEPMTIERKMRLFKMLCAIGFKEIEVGFPSASQTEFDFVRQLIDDHHIPDDVTISVLTQSRDHLIRRTLQSIEGARRAIVHLYNATSPTFRDTVFGMSREQVIELAVGGVRLIRELTSEQPRTEWQLEYSPETFTATELEFAKTICDAAVAAWGATPERKVILNLPATVEVATPNVYADQIEWMHRNLARRESIVLSAHPHNDRGCAIAAAELAQMAGAERVEGCLFGNGERTGNVDLVTLALNLYTQGVDPQLDFSRINDVARLVEYCNQLPIHPRHPYVGDLVFTAFSGSHQDAIKKGMALRNEGEHWSVPYLPIDPADLGRSYDSIVRINSQSGKGGVAYLLESEYGLVLPRRLQVEFSAVVQSHAEQAGGEVSAKDLWQLFGREYLSGDGPMKLIEHHLFEAASQQGVRLMLEIEGKTVELRGTGNGPLDAASHALGLPLVVQSYEERSLGQGAQADAIAFIELRVASESSAQFGVGVHANIITASIAALLSGVNRCLLRMKDSERASWLSAVRDTTSLSSRRVQAR